MKRIIPVRLLIVAFACCFTTACAGGSAGVGVSGAGGGVGGGITAAGGGRYLSPSPEAAAEFEKGIIRPDYNYYYSGAEAYPNAIIGLDRRYLLTNNLWQKVQLTPATLKDWLDYMRLKAVQSRQSLHGFNILDAQGNRIGIWISVLDAIPGIQIKMQPDNGVWIDTPPQDPYHEYDRGGRFGGSGFGGGLFFGF